MIEYIQSDTPPRHLVRWNFLASYFLWVGFWLYQGAHAFSVRHTLHVDFAGYGGPETFIFMFMWAIILGGLWVVYRTDNIQARFLAGAWGILILVVMIVPMVLTREVTDTVPKHVPNLIIYVVVSHLIYAFFGKKQEKDW